MPVNAVKKECINTALVWDPNGGDDRRIPCVPPASHATAVEVCKEHGLELCVHSSAGYADLCNSAKQFTWTMEPCEPQPGEVQPSLSSATDKDDSYSSSDEADGDEDDGIDGGDDDEQNTDVKDKHASVEDGAGHDGDEDDEDGEDDEGQFSAWPVDGAGGSSRSTRQRKKKDKNKFYSVVRRLDGASACLPVEAVASVRCCLAAQ